MVIMIRESSILYRSLGSLGGTDTTYIAKIIETINKTMNGARPMILLIVK